MKSAEFFLSTTVLEDLPEGDKPHIAIIGRSNVGKSSLINHLTGRKDLARVSATAGRTETINLYNIDKKYFLVDLPGYGFTQVKSRREEFAELITNYLANTEQLKLVLVVIDAYVGPVDLDIAMFNFLHSRAIPLIIVVNKIDKLSKSKAIILLQKLKTTYSFATFIPHSVDSKENRAEILRAINAHVA